MSRVRWVMHALGTNPLIRRTDRLEAISIVLIIGLSLIAIPFVNRIGDDISEARMQTISAQQRDWHPVTAVALNDSSAPSARFAKPAPVRAQWKEGTQLRTELVPGPVFLKAGAPLTVWLDGSGKIVHPPTTADEVRSSMTSRAWAVWLSAVAAAALVAAGLRRWLDRSRTRAWERELQLLAHNDDGWANRLI
ncbi:Rv1733c family protein [Mycolicibacterium komossense]|uniref:Transmembrane protein n=1 Tax=Mycolicibacterium komossense TaxID=1779 RepID=A0ABT3CI64_9MYCO|nr:hypothetical protein [Mycolicibacterium komossense]MCV7229047.1 hypothetical protein [Mycolicibacterium komossense]